MQPLLGLDLSKLYRNLVFHSDSAAESHQELSRFLHTHALTLGQGSVNTSLFQRKLNHVSVMMLTYGAEVEIQAGVFEDFTLFQTPLRGSAEFEAAGIRTKVERGEVAVLSPGHSIRFHWQQGCEQLILKIPHAVVNPHEDNTAANHLPPTNGQDICLPPIFKLDPRVTAPWHSLVQQVIDLPEPDKPTPQHSNWYEHFERTIARFMLSQQPSISSYSDNSKHHLKHIESTTPPASKTPLDRIEKYIQSRLYAPISLQDLANIAGLSPRSLHDVCQRFRGVSPMVLLRNVRLDAVRRKLLSCTNANVTEVALDHGFEHLGRFAAYYRERFGELPRETAVSKPY